MKKVLIVIIIMFLSLSVLSSCSLMKKPSDDKDNDDPCPCCPNCIQKDCECIECGDSDDCECKLPNGGEFDWIIVFDEATASSPNKQLPQYFIECYTLNLKVTKSGGETPFGEFSGNGDLENVMDTSGALAASGGKSLVDEMEWEKAPLEDISFVLYGDDDILDLSDDDIPSLISPLGVSTKEHVSWSVIARRHVVGNNGEGEKEIPTTFELSYRIVIYKDGIAELYLYDTTAQDTLCFQGVVEKKPIKK